MILRIWFPWAVREIPRKGFPKFSLTAADKGKWFHWLGSATHQDVQIPVEFPLLALTLAGCGEDPAAPGLAETVRIGFLAAGDRVTYVDAAGIAVAEANERGGVLGMPVELVSRSEIEEASVSVETAERMIVEDEVVALVGPNRSSHAIAVAELAQRHGLPMVTTSATNPEVTKAGDFVFMAAFTDMFQGQVMAQFAREELGLARVAV